MNTEKLTSSQEWEKFRRTLQVTLAESSIALLIPLPNNMGGYIAVVLWFCTLCQGLNAIKSQQ